MAASQKDQQYDTINNYHSIEYFYILFQVIDAELETFPPEIGNLRRLHTLGARSNRIASLPPSLCSLPALRWLHLADNRIHSLPDTFSQLGSLAQLNLDGNRLRAVPACLTAMPRLVGVSLRGNPIDGLGDDLVLGLAGLDRLDLRDTGILRRPEHWRVGCWRLLSLVERRLLAKCKAVTFYA